MLYRTLLRPILFRLPPETAHELALHSLPFLFRSPLLRKFMAGDSVASKFAPLERFGLSFNNPVGLAAGFDKNGVALDELAALGFGHIEAGTVTALPQPGNPKPRLFRLPMDQGLINRAGFNNDGADAFAERAGKLGHDFVLGVSIGKSRAATNEEAVLDYLNSFAAVYPVADYIAINVSSPNTPGLRELQQSTQLEMLLSALQQRNHELALHHSRPRPVPLLVKLAPDLTEGEMELIVSVARRANIAGLIATNTTIARDGLKTAVGTVTACGAGGLSGMPLQARATRMIAHLYHLSSGAMKIIGVGGIFTAQDAWDKICAGSSLVQLYTGFIYQGPAIANKINRGLVEILKREGFASIDDAVGCRAGEFTKS